MPFAMLNRAPPLRVLIAAPRGFCAGVDRAIQIVELALERFGAPVYVRHEIVHNRYVVDRLREMGAVFVDELDEVPDDRPVVFSAHGVPKSVPAQAQDATFVNLPGLLSTHCVKSGSSSYLAVDLTPTPTGKQPADISGDIRSQGKILNDWGLHLVDVNLVMGNLQSLIRKQAASYAH